MYAEPLALDALVTQAQRGDAFAIERLLQISYPKLLRLAKCLVRSEDVARDIVQETMLAVSMKLDGLRNPRAFDIWAGQILKRRYFSHFRRRRRERLVTADVDAAAKVEFAALPDEPDHLANAQLLKAVGSLGGRNRQVVKLHYFLGLSLEEIASEVDASVGAVKLRLHRARIELRNRLAPPAAAS